MIKGVMTRQRKKEDNTYEKNKYKKCNRSNNKDYSGEDRKSNRKGNKNNKESSYKKRCSKKEVAETVFVQYASQEYDINEIKAAVKKAWTEETDKKESDITEIQIYVKPEEAAAYYVVNGEVAEGGNKILL